MNQREFAQAMNVGTSTVSRWVKGRIPDARFLERIADVLVLDYDEVATRAGIRPEGIGPIEPGSPEAQLLSLMRRVQWNEERIALIRGNLELFIQADKLKGKQ